MNERRKIISLMGVGLIVTASVVATPTRVIAQGSDLPAPATHGVDFIREVLIKSVRHRELRQNA